MATIKFILIPLMLAWLLLQKAATLLSTFRNQLTLLLLTAALVHRDVQEYGLMSLPPEVLYIIVQELECPPPETTIQSSDSQRYVLVLSQ